MTCSFDMRNRSTPNCQLPTSKTSPHVRLWALGIGRWELWRAQRVREVLLKVYIVAIREIGAEVAAARFLAPQRRPRDEKPDSGQARHAPEIAVRRRRGATRGRRGTPRCELRHGCSQSIGVTYQAGVTPRQIADRGGL